jgi:hypothetical protein
LAIALRAAAESAGSSRRPNQPAGGKYNLRANSIQINPSKTKQNYLVLLGFIRPNRDFSMGYGEKNKKNRLASQVVCKTSQTNFSSVLSHQAAGKALAWSGDWE